jgi:prepilin-type N-terminal cleavage/methylation domain-containing protein
MNKRRRSAVTLLELMVVLAIIVLISAVSIPSIAGMSGSFKLNGGVDSVRAGWAEARSRAIEEGRPYRFAVEPSGTAFRIAPDEDAYWQGGTGPDNDPNGRGLIREKALPAGCSFQVNGSGGSPPAADAGSLAETVPSGATWTPAVIFLPDGTTREDVRLTFNVRGCKSTTLYLRALTGNVSVQREQ